MATGWAGARTLTAKKSSRTRLVVVNELSKYFVDNVTLADAGEHNEWFTKKIIRGLLKQHSEKYVRGMLEDVVFLSEEVIAGRLPGFKIKSAGLLRWTCDKYSPETKAVMGIFGRDYDEFTGTDDLVVLGDDK